MVSVALMAAAFLAAPSGPIAFSDLPGDLSVANADGSGTQMIFESVGPTLLQSLAISADGKSVLAVESGDQQQLVLVPFAGGDPAPVAGTTDADAGSFSPDGKSVVFSTAAGIFTVALAGGSPKKLAATPDGDADSLPQYSPDGKQIAFARDTGATVMLELMPAAGGTPMPLTSGLFGNLSQGGRISFSPDGQTLLYAGDGDDPGIFSVAASGGSETQLTTDSDYWPSFSADGSTVLFVRDAASDHADDNALSPVAPADGDFYELWAMAKDGSGAAVIAEGDFETLAIAQPAAPSGGGSSSGGQGGSSGGSGGSSGGPATGKGSTTTASTAISVTKKGNRYIVRWTGKASEWRVTLKVGKTKAGATVKGSLHSHTFTLPRAKGAASARVTAR